MKVIQKKLYDVFITGQFSVMVTGQFLPLSCSNFGNKDGLTTTHSNFVMHRDGHYDEMPVAPLFRTKTPPSVQLSGLTLTFLSDVQVGWVDDRLVIDSIPC